MEYFAKLWIDTDPNPFVISIIIQTINVFNVNLRFESDEFPTMKYAETKNKHKPIIFPVVIFSPKNNLSNPIGIITLAAADIDVIAIDVICIE